MIRSSRTVRTIAEFRTKDVIMEKRLQPAREVHRRAVAVEAPVDAFSEDTDLRASAPRGRLR